MEFFKKTHININNLRHRQQWQRRKSSPHQASETLARGTEMKDLNC